MIGQTGCSFEQPVPTGRTGGLEQGDLEGPFQHKPLHDSVI